MIDNENTKIINFIEDFGCCTLKQLQILLLKIISYFSPYLILFTR